MPIESEISSNFTSLKTLFNGMVAQGPRNMKSQVVEAKEIDARQFSVRENCDAAVQTLAKFARGEIDLHKAKFDIVKSLHSDSARGMQYALSEGEHFKTENMSGITVKISMADHVKHDEMIALLDFAADFFDKINS
jgi:uncharacterized protein YbcI